MKTKLAILTTLILLGAACAKDLTPHQATGSSNGNSTQPPGPSPSPAPSTQSLPPFLENSAKSVQLNIGYRKRWDSNFGYGGETAFQSVGLYFGQYVSQWDARAFASNSMDQSKSASQLVIGINETVAADALKLNYEKWTDGSTEAFLLWVKQNIKLGFPVIVGMQNGSGDPDYDIIVPIIGIKNDGGIKSDYDPSDYFIFDPQDGISVTGRTADQLKTKSSTYGFPSTKKYGIAIRGIKDTANETYALSAVSNLNHEGTQPSGNVRPQGFGMVLSYKVYGLTAGQSYRIYNYTSYSSTPTSQFLLSGEDFSTFTATSSTHVFEREASSNQQLIRRVIKAP